MSPRALGWIGLGLAALAVGPAYGSFLASGCDSGPDRVLGVIAQVLGAVSGYFMAGHPARSFKGASVALLIGMVLAPISVAWINDLLAFGLVLILWPVALPGLAGFTFRLRHLWRGWIWVIVIAAAIAWGWWLIETFRAEQGICF